MTSPILASELTFTAIRYHRNGCSGASFYVVWFTFDCGEELYGRTIHQLQATVFDAAGHIAVTSANLREGWRGDYFEAHIRAYIETETAQRMAFAA